MKVKAMNPFTASGLTFKTFTMFSISLFLLIMLLSAFFIVPKFNSLLDVQHEQDVESELALEAALFSRFIVSQQSIVQDLAAYPSLTAAVMLGDSNDLAINELFDNATIGGKKSRLVLQDIAGTIVIKTENKLYGNYDENQPWIEQVLNGAIDSHFQLLRQDNSALTFKVSVPVFYNTFIEGLLSSEITVPLKDIFVTQVFNDNVAFKLTQGAVAINTGTEHIEIHRENSLTLPETDIVFTYITDDSLIYAGKRSLQNTTLLVLLIGFSVSFLLFAGLNYRGLTGGEGTSKVKLATWKNYTIPIMVAVIGVGASISAFMIASNLKETAIEKELIHESQEKIAAVSEKIALDLQVSDYVKAFFSASDYVNLDDFNEFIAPLLVNHQNITSIEWLPFIKHQQLDGFEQRAKVDGMSDFFIKEENTRGEFIPATPRESYFPIYYVAPMVGNEQRLGFDIASNSHCLMALNKAKNSGDKVATLPMVLTGGVGTQAGIHVFNPVYASTWSSGNVAQQRNLLGFILTTLDIKAIFTEIQNTEIGNLLFYVEDITDPDNIESIYGARLLDDAFFREETINVGGRNWRVGTYNNTTKTPLIFSAWLVLITGLTLSGLITLGITHLIHRREIVEQLVDSRTTELKASEAQHRAVVENAIDGLLTLDEYGIIETYNHAAQGIFGYTLEEVIGVNIKILMPEYYYAENDAYFKNYRDTGVKETIATGQYLEARRKDGTVFPIDLSVSEVVFGNTRKLSGIVRDITERVALEKEREKFIDKLTDSNEELARFAFVCSHDLQEPLRMVRSFSEKLQEHLTDNLKDDAKGQKYFNFVIDGAARAQTLIADILAYSSISSDTQMLEKVSLIDIIAVIKSDLLDASTGKKGELTFDPLPELQGNKTQLFQLFQNLISNGLKYQKPDATPHVHVGVEDHDKHWVFIVKDNGIGMEERHLTKIFEVFQRLHGRRQYAGTGVGLSICKKVVERHGGTIWVESEKNMGSTFYIKLLKPEHLEEM